MKLQKVFLKSLSMLVVPAMLLGLSMPVFAMDQPGMNNQMQNLKNESQLEKNVRHALVMLPYYTVFDNLEFSIENGNTVVLTGQVVQAYLKDDAETAVERVPGVEKVINNIEILPLSPFDNSIRRREFRHIYGQVGFERYAIQAVPPIHIIVKNGDVTLIGVVADQYDKDVAGLVAKSVPNVFHVTNDLRVENNS